MLNKIRIFQLFSIIGLIVINSAVLFSQTNAKFQTARAFDGGLGYATADFNGDGKLDVVSMKIDRLNVSLGDGKGSFNQLPNPIFMCSIAFSSNANSEPLTGDFNGDGKIDIAAWVPDASCSGVGLRGLMLFPGNGSGGFSTPVFKSVSNFFFTPDQFFAADFNGDGRLDFAVGSSNSSTDGDRLGVFLNSGGGSFAEPVVYNLGGQVDYGLVLGDFNGDQRPELLYFRRSSSALMLLPNNGDGTFSSPQNINSGTDFGISPAGDFNNDGKLDFVTIQSANFQSRLRIWQGNGNNTFTAGPISTIETGNSGLARPLPGDYNRDGQLDLAFTTTGKIVVCRGNANGTFAEDETYFVGGGRILKGDFNNDNWTDLIAQQVIGAFTGVALEFSVLLNAQNGKFISSPSLDLDFGGNEVTIADFNNDGLKDIALTGDANQGEILLLLQGNSATKNDSKKKSVEFDEANRTAMGIGGISPQAIAVGDFNNDGKNDVVVGGQAASGTTENVLVAKNDGAGNLSLASTLSLGRIVTQIVPGDYNTDGNLDLAFSINPEMLPNNVPTVSVALGLGNGSFSAPVGYLPGLIAVSLTKGDFNGDGKQDLAVAHSNSKITVLLNNGTGNFTPSTPFDLQFSPTEIAASDLTGDGKQDLVVVYNTGYNDGSATVSVFVGNGNGTFAAPVNYKTAGLQKQRLAIDDFNGDGKPDVAVTNSGVITVLINNGSGVLTQRTLWGHAGWLVDIASGDLNNDQKTDFVTTSIISTGSYSGCLSFAINDTSEPLNSPAKFDFDGDGKSDISVFRPENGSWYIQQSTAGFTGLAFGLSTDKLVPADYDGDGKTDVAVVRNGTWYIQRSQSGFTGIAFGDGNDIPVPADYDGDGKAELAVFRPSNGYWYILNLTTNQFTAVLFGISTDKPVPADYDGDGKTDIAVNRNGNWYIQRSQLGFTGILFGDSNDKSVPADYDGDGKTDIAVFRPSNGTWYLLQSSAGFRGTTFGLGTDIPVAADYDGDGKADISVVRNGNWYLQRSSQGFTGILFGNSSDKPIPNAFVR